jgi:V8-like Glu-specific endopeptidase
MTVLPDGADPEAEPPTDGHVEGPAGPPADVQADIAQRWDESAEQVAQTAEAVRLGELRLANTADEITERRERLQRQGLVLEGIVDEDDSVWLSFFSRGLAAARSVGRVVGLQPPAPATPVGTGVLIGPGLLLTNNHVIPSVEDAAAMGVQFGYEYDDNGAERRYQTCPFEPDRCFWTNEELDFSVVAVADLRGRPAGKKYGTVRLIEQTGKALKAEVVNVVHHPGGDRKRLSIRENRIVAEDDLWLRYTSDARRGSSGAPVFNDQWEMVALHHGGVPKRDAEGVALNRAGEPWTREMGEEAKAYAANEGARVSRIVHRLRDAGLDPAAKAMIDEALGSGGNT